MLSIVAIPLRTEAVAVEIGAGVVLVCSALLAAVGITITSNNDTICSNFLDSCCDDLRNFIYDAGDTWKVGYNKILEVSADMWDNLEVDAHKYFKNYLESSNINFISVSENASGIYGFTEDESTQLKFHVPSFSSDGGYATLFADNYSITYYRNYDAFSLYDWHLLGSYTWYDYKYFSGFTMYFESNDLTIILGEQHSNPYVAIDSFDVICKPYSFNYEGITNFLSTNVIGTINGNYFKVQNNSDGYFVMDLTNNNVISLTCKGQSKTYFSNLQSMYEWLFESVGLAHPNSAKLFDVAVPSTDTTFNDLASDVVIDKDYFPTDEDVEAETKESVSVVIPVSIADVSTETVTDTTANDIYPDGLPAISAPSTLWDKFPFCLPWDIYRLVSVFWDGNLSDPIRWEIPFVLSDLGVAYNIIIDFSNDSIGNDDDGNILIGLSNFSFIVDLIRFFVGFFYVLGLIMVTRKLIGGE